MAVKLRVHRAIPLGLAAAWMLMPTVVWSIPDATGAVSATAPDLSGDAAMTSRLNYNLGFEQFEKAQKLESSAAALSGSKARQMSQAAIELYEQVRERMRTATNADPALKEAWNLIGYTSRRLGDYDESLEAYDKALKLQPDYPEAIEYRAELFLLTGRIIEAKAAYEQLLKASPSYAAVLLQSMQDWLAKPANKAIVAAPENQAFVAWVGAQAK
jgi:tetratricopeptide (TPR) repeat protein